MSRVMQDGRADKWHGMLRVGVIALSRMSIGVLVARSAGTHSFAVFVGLVTVEVLASTLLTAGRLTAIGSIAPRLDAAAGSALLRFGLVQSLRTAGVVTTSMLVTTPLWGFAGVRLDVAAAFALSTGAWLASTASAAVLVARFRSGTALLCQGLAFVPCLGTLTISWRLGCDPLVALFLSGAGSHLLAAIAMTRALGTASPLGVEPACLAEVRSTGRVVLWGSVANSVCTRVQPFVLAALGGPIAIGLFGAANTLAGPLRVLAGAIGDVLRPRLALHQSVNGDPARGHRLLVRTLGILGTVGALSVCGAALFGSTLGVSVFGERFDGLGSVLPAAALFVTLAAIVHVLVVAMQTRSYQGAAVATRARTVAALFALSSVGPACLLDGARGAFLSMCAGEAWFLAIAVRFLTRRPEVTLHAVPA